VNLLTAMPHLVDIVRNDNYVTTSDNTDPYNQPRTVPVESATPTFSSVPCVFYSNIARALFTTDVIKSAGSVLAQFMIDADTVGEDIHLGDYLTNCVDQRGNVVSDRLWFIYRISKFADQSGAVYYNLMVALDEAGPRN
jgi:hypothetical protein